MSNDKQNKSVIKLLYVSQNLLDTKEGCVKYKQLEYILQNHNINKIPFKNEILDYMKRKSFCFLVSMLPCPGPDYDRRDYYPGSLGYYSDDEYTWDSLDIYILEKYNVELPEDFINHVLSKL